MSVTYTIDIKYLSYIENVLLKNYKIIFITNNQYELKISFYDVLTLEEEEVFFKELYGYRLY